MTAPIACRDMVLLTQAEIDGELAPAEAIAALAHRASCAECAAAYRLIRATRQTLSGSATRYAMPEALRAALQRQIRSEGEALAARRPGAPRSYSATGWLSRFFDWWRPGALFGVGAGTGALAAAAMALLFVTAHPQEIADAAVGGHIRALQPGHLIDLKSTKEHNVRPWFDGKLDFSPPVKDFADQGYPLEGGRLDYIDGHAAAALVYNAGRHAIDVFIWPSQNAADAAPRHEMRNGYGLYHWTEGNMAIWVVSDLDPAKLTEFVELWRRSP